MRARRLFVDADYGQLHLRMASPDDSSSVTPLVCLHQSPKSGREFARFIEFASPDRLVVAPDYPGYGESDCPPDKPEVSIEDYARTMWQALDALDIDVVDLFGNHTGDAVAVEMAHQQPDRIRQIAMISAPVLTPQEQAQFDDYFQPVALDEKGTRFVQAWERINHYRAEGMTFEMMAISFAESFRWGEAYEWGHRAAFAYNDLFIERIAELTQRIVVLNPADLLHEITMRVEPLLQNGVLIDLPEWSSEVLNIHTATGLQNIVKALLGMSPVGPIS